MATTSATLIMTGLLPSMLIEVVVPLILLVVLPIIFIKNHIR